MKLQNWERWSIIIILLAAWGLRWIALMDVPPGWRDDDLIELYTFSWEILNSGPKLYFTEASGQGPLYHTIRAPLLAVAGVNQASARWLSALCGTVSVLLTWAVGRRMFTREVGVLAGGLTAISFWALMYSRVAVRHIGALPWMLLGIYWGWRALQDSHLPRGAMPGIASGIAGAVMTYYAGRLVPVLLVVALPFVGARKERWRPYLLSIAIGLLLTVPMFIAAAQTSGSDARVSEVAVPLQEFRNGNPRPLLGNIWTTLGMFHAKGDPEWLYNIAERPVFGIVGAAIFYLGLLTRLAHLNQANARMMLLWLSAGISPALISFPASSYGHTILALPATYILLAMPMKAAARRWRWTTIPLIAITLLTVAARDLPDYFIAWPQHSMVRFLYRADYRALTNYLETHPDITDLSVGSFLFGPWDRVAVQTDLRHNAISKLRNASVRWVNPERTLVGRDTLTPFYVQEENLRHPHIQEWLNTMPRIEAPAGLEGYLLTLPTPQDKEYLIVDDAYLKDTCFNAALTLYTAAWSNPPLPGQTSDLILWWDITVTLPLPPEKLIAYPPPPGVYNGPRLKVFTHLISATGEIITSDDGLWVNPYSLQPGDRVVQWHHFDLTGISTANPYQVAIGLYDPLTGERWHLPNGEDAIHIPISK
ncbi:MAG: glycosyltransferase family 39 protein [Anaerolineae bacterium]|nr:glycosyltransferase family 39 protein [Anaerolineae bacterium]